jgi:type I restriction enzyme S subunit
MTNWKEYKVEDFAEVIGGGTPSTKNEAYFGGSIPWITPRDLTNYDSKFIKNGDRNITKEGLKNSSAKLIPKNAILLTSRAPIGYLVIAQNEVSTNQGFKSIVVNPEIADYNFIFYLIKANIERIKSFGTGTTFAEVSASIVKNLKFNLPDLPTQTAIAEILSSLDDKIELNNKINQELENLAQTLFKQWFIDFEFHCLPENYKFSGAVKPTDFDAIMTYKRVGGLPLPDGQSWFVYVLLSDDESFYKGMTNDLYRRFYEHFTGIGADHTKMHQPVKVIHWEQFDSKEEAAIREKELKTGYGRTWLQRQWAKVNGGSPAPECQLRMAGEMIDSELGEIPKGWEVGTFGDLCKIVNGYAFKSKDFQEKGSNGILKIRNVNGNVVDIINTQFVSNGVVQSVQDKFKVLSGHILIAMTGAEVGKTGIVPETDKSLWLNQRVGRLEPIIDNSKVFIYHMFNVLNFTQAVRNSAMGSAQPNISASGIESLNCLIPAEEVALNFSSINLDSFNLTLKNMGENQELTNLRDTLLPKLISGELEVSEVKEG